MDLVCLSRPNIGPDWGFNRPSSSCSSGGVQIKAGICQRISPAFNRATGLTWESEICCFCSTRAIPCREIYRPLRGRLVLFFQPSTGANGIRFTSGGRKELKGHGRQRRQKKAFLELHVSHSTCEQMQRNAQISSAEAARHPCAGPSLGTGNNNERKHSDHTYFTLYANS